MIGRRLFIASPWQPGREKLLLAVACLGIWAVIGVLFVSYGYLNTWGLWNLPVLWPYFHDLRLIPGTAESLRLGLDPTVQNPGDPLNRIFNYPRIWYLVAYTSISQDDVLWLGILMIVLFFTGVLLFPAGLRKSAVVMLLVVLFSPACMLLYERGNFDLLIFFLCALAVSLSEVRLGASAFVILIASLLKLFPFFGLGIFLFKGRRMFWTVLLCVAIPFAAYLALTLQNVNASWNLTERGSDLSYGVSVWVKRYEPIVKEALRQSSLEARQVRYAVALLLSASYLAASLLGLGALLAGWYTRTPLAGTHPRNLNAFWMGAAIFCGTFMLGNNWDYRLAFLVFTLPALADWTCESSGSRRRMLVIVFVLVVLSTWYFRLNPQLYDRGYRFGFLGDEFFNWGLFAGLAYLLGASLPDWVRGLPAAFSRLGCQTATDVHSLTGGHLRVMRFIHLSGLAAILLAVAPLLALPWQAISWVRLSLIGCMLYLLYHVVHAWAELRHGRPPAWVYSIQLPDLQSAALVILTVSAALGFHYFRLPAQPAAAVVIGTFLSLPQWLGPAVALAFFLSVLGIVGIFVVMSASARAEIRISELLYRVVPLAALFVLTHYLLSWHWRFLAGPH